MIADGDVELIEAVYAATTDEGTLKDAAVKYLALQQDAGAAMFHYDSILEKAGDFEIVTLDPSVTKLVQEIFDRYAESEGAVENPLIKVGFDDLIAGKILISDEVIPFAEFSQTSYYKAVFEPLGIRHSMGWVAAGRGQKWLTFTNSRDSSLGKYSVEHVDRAKLFQRHLARAIHILELLDEANKSKEIFEQSIEKVPHGIVLVDDNLRIHFHNKAAADLIARSPALSHQGDHFRAGFTSHERARFEHWWNLLVGLEGSDGACFNDVSMHPVWEIEVSRLASDHKKPSNARRWMLTLKCCPDGNDLPEKYLMARFGLTQAEARVSCYLCRNGDAVSTAKAMGLTPNTVRTHLKSAFRKTGTRNQVELALKLVS